MRGNCGTSPLLLGHEGQEIANGGKLARRRGRPKTLAPAFGEEGAQVLSAQGDSSGRRRYGLAAIWPRKSMKPMRRRDIGARGVRGAPAVVEEMACQRSTRARAG